MELDIDVEARLSASLNGIQSELARAREERLRARATETPRFVDLAGVVTIPAGGFAWIPLNIRGPDSGHFWFVRKIVVGGLTPVTAAAGRADVFVSAADFTNLSLAQVGLTAWRDQAVTLPLVGPYSKGELVVKAEEYLQIAVSNGTPNQQYACAVVVEDFQEASAVRNWGV